MTFKRPDIIRPPSEAGSYFLPLTSGCSNNSCGFCNYYGCKLVLRDAGEVKKEIDAVALYVNHGLRTPAQPQVVYAIAGQWDGRRVFLQDGDALVYPTEQLKDVLGHLNQKMPGIERVGSYGTAQDILRCGTNDLKELKELKLSILYMGVESGDDRILSYIGKRVTSEQLIEAGRKVKEAGILLSVTVLLGLGGVEESLEHAVATARVLSAMDPDYVGALTLTLIPGTPMYDDSRSGKFSQISPFQSLQELKFILQNFKATNCFFSSMHASNYLSVRGKVPGDQERMLAQIEDILARNDPSLLKPEFLRGL